MPMIESLRFNEEIEVNGGKLIMNKPTSGRLIGEVTVKEYDKSGKLMFSDTTHNDITLPGSIFVLEQMFKRGSKSSRFLHPNTFPTGYNNQEVITPTEYSNELTNTEWNKQILDSNIIDSYISDEYVFGFMVGNGGETSTSIVAPTYEYDSLKDTGSTNSYLPFRITNVVNDNVEITDANKDPSDDGVDYYLKMNNGVNNYFYAKGFTIEPKIYAKWSDGSGEVSSVNIGYNVPILTYAEVTLDIDESDIREFFPASQSEDCYINQLGLVAGKPIWIKDRQGLYYHDTANDTYSKLKPEEFESVSETDIIGNSISKPVMYRRDFNDVKLVTTLNFKSKDLSNDENTLKFIYKIYCL